jgi:hypothetical protein
MLHPIAAFGEQHHRRLHLTQPDLATKASSGRCFGRDLEQHKATLRTASVNIALRLFGYELALAPLDRQALSSAP